VTVDEEFKGLGDNEIEVLGHTRDACDKSHIVRIICSDGGVTLKPKETKYFRTLHKDGSWNWICIFGVRERARISGAVFIKAVRKANGVIDWYKVRKK
jgi:hypothetical protein